MTPLALLLAAAPVPKDATADFTWKLAKGDVFYVAIDTVTDGNIKCPPRIAVAVDSISQRTEGVWKVTVAAADADRVVLDLEAVSYSSASTWNARVNATKEVADAAGEKFTLTFDPAFRLSKVAGGEGWDKLLAKQTQSSGMHTAKGVGRAFEHVFQAVPGGRQGKGWERKEDVLDRDAKTADTWTRRATVREVKDGLATVTTETDLDGTNEDNGRSVFVPHERKAEKCPGSFTFNTATGRIERFEEALSITGTSGGKGQGIGYTGTVRTTVTLSAKPPKK